MMKFFKYLFFFISLLFLSCEKDPLINYDCSLPADGLLCKTYIFENSQCIGYIDYEYNANLQKETEYLKTPKGKVEKTFSYVYNAQGLISEENIDKNSSTKNEKIVYSYSATNKILKTEHFDNEMLSNSAVYVYDSTDNLTTTNIFYQSALDTVIKFEYDTKGKLWRQSFYNKDNSISSYQIHIYFDNGVERINLFNVNDVYLGYNLLTFNASGNITLFSAFDRDNVLTEKIIYDYENDRLIKETRKDGAENIVSYKVLFYS